METIEQNFNIVDANIVMDGKDAVLTANYLLAAGNLYIVTYRIHPSGVVKADFTFTSTDMEAAKTEASEATLMATFLREAMRRARLLLNWKYPYRCTLPSACRNEPGRILRTRTGGKLCGP